ncbi:hypothetical protein niasHT_031932 [Heterodera trifolii]|uniref:Uncharacterized protein n=1 Tax=Heterodera trifolii TaxID=157864 RepID=A0ABD2IEG2_9BILA
MFVKPLFVCPILLAIFGQICCDILGRKQNAGAKGYLTCKGKPAKNVKVKLYDDDRGIDRDDLMGETMTNSRGYFEVTGHTSEYSTIDPKINIYHNCADGYKPCYRKFTIKINDNYVSSGKNPPKLYDIKHIELKGKRKGESRDCLN